MTIEVASVDDTFPIPLDRVNEIYEENKDVLEISSVIAKEIELSR